MLKSRRLMLDGNASSIADPTSKFLPEDCGKRLWKHQEKRQWKQH